MPWIDRRSLQHFDWPLFGLVALLVGMGLANLYSATRAGVEEGLPPEFKRQLLALALGTPLMLIALFVDYRRLERLAAAIFAATLVLLASTLVLAPVIRGNRSWLIYGPISLQPSELAKLGLVIALARWFHRNPASRVTRLRDLLPPALIAALPVGIIVLQRDMGVAVLTLLVACTYLPFTGIPWRAWGALAGAGLLGLAGVWFFALRDYQQKRVLDFLDPSRDPLASGYQAIQSKIAIGSGGLFGKGYLEGTQTQLRFLPTQHSDFAFSVLAEEWGFVGGAVFLALYFGLLLWGLWVARNSKDGFGAMLAVGIVGLAPVVGVAFPLLSYGGSALLASLIGLGLLLNVSMRRYMF